VSSGASAASVESGRWRAGVEAVLPANASTDPNAFIDSVSCPSAGNCVAVGQYLDSSGADEGVLLTETAGKWGAGIEASLPANATTQNQFVRLVSVSCASAGNCSAVGDYEDGSSSPTEGLLLTETAGSWGTGVEAVLPANAATPNEGASVVSISCASAGNCSAAGFYFDSSHVERGLLLTETEGTWGAGVEAPPPANAAAAPWVSLDSVSCASAGNCGVVGSYVDSSGDGRGLLLTETGGSWATGVEAQPANAIGSSQTSWVSCPSAGNCSAILGDYLLTQTTGSWATGVETVLPANACPVGPGPGQCDGTFGGANSISCASAGNCVAVGDYTDSFGDDAGLLLTETAGAWGAGIEAPPGASGVSVTLSSVSCASAGNCSAVGSDNGVGLLLTKTAGKWTAAEAALPANAFGAAELYSVSCPSAGHCSAVGNYADSSGNHQGLLLDSQPPPPCEVPRLTGKTLAAAARSIRTHGCSVGKITHAASPTIKKGNVILQKPKPGRRLKHGAKVNLVVSKGRR